MIRSLDTNGRNLRIMYSGNKLVILAVVGLLYMTSCGDNTFDRFVPPQLLLYQGQLAGSIKLTDSLKNAVKGQNVNKAYRFKIKWEPREDRSKVENIVYVSVTGGNGQLRFENNVIKPDSSIQGLSSRTEVELSFYPAVTEGRYILTFRAQNELAALGAPCELTLEVFENLAPVANFEIKSGQDGTYSRILDASKSYDRDQKYGGVIKTLNYDVSKDGVSLKPVRSYDNTTFLTPVVLGGAGTYTITLKVYDDDGVASEPIAKTLILN